VTQIQNLTQYPNVQPVGYVRTGYAGRDIDDVLHDISVYSGWKTTDRAGVNVTAMAMHGIFFDEAPHEYTSENADYMSRINKAAKDASGIISPKTVCSPVIMAQGCPTIFLFLYALQPASYMRVLRRQ
jgi:Spherulation-specific family 4